MMTLDEAILHCEARAKADCSECAKEHLQLAEWLEQLKRYKDLEEQGLLQRASTIHGWIPCGERLPKENQNVIACFAHGPVTELRFYDGKFHGIYDYNTNVIIAWQPLPKPYTG